MNKFISVGKSSANWTPIFANWIQLANTCQLEASENHTLTAQLARWQLADGKLLPTETTNCFYYTFHPISVGNNTPLPTGEVDTPDRSRDVYLVLGRLRVVCKEMR